jgi:hypothetical protein
LLALGLVTLAAFGIERLIVTDVEAIENLAAKASEAIEERRFEVLEGLMAEDFTYAGRDRAATVAYVRRLVEKHQPPRVGLSLTRVEVDGDGAEASGVVLGTVYGRPMRYPVQAVLVRGEDGWRLSRVKGGR